MGGPKGWGPKKKVANAEIYVIFEVFAFCGGRTKTDFKDRGETPLITDSLVRTLMALEEGWNIFNRGKAAHLAGFHTPPLVSLYADISFKESLSTTKYWPESMFQQNLKVAWYCFLESEDTLYFWPWLLVRIAA